MPIYAYRCTECGHAKDVLQRMSDPLLHTCPACGAEAFAKQVTAAGFQLKGSGWYATDFKGSGAAPATGGVDKGKDKSADQEGQSNGNASAAADSKSVDSKSADSKPADTPSSPAAAPSASASPSSSAAASTGS
jgi:putative FmdB family regulatory protein